jgi:4-oxalomesaconate tautomerase
MGISGTESPEVLEADDRFKQRVEQLRLKLGPLMNLGDVTNKSVPKMTLVSESLHGGILSTRSLIPHRVHAGIGVMAAVTVAAACLLPGSVAAELASLPEGEAPDGELYDVEHPSGKLQVLLQRDDKGRLIAAGTQRTARKLLDGYAFV